MKTITKQEIQDVIQQWHLDGVWDLEDSFEDIEDKKNLKIEGFSTYEELKKYLLDYEEKYVEKLETQSQNALNVRIEEVANIFNITLTAETKNLINYIINIEDVLRHSIDSNNEYLLELINNLEGQIKTIKEKF